LVGSPALRELGRLHLRLPRDSSLRLCAEGLCHRRRCVAAIRTLGSLRGTFAASAAAAAAALPLAASLTLPPAVLLARVATTTTASALR